MSNSVLNTHTFIQFMSKNSLKLIHSFNSFKKFIETTPFNVIQYMFHRIQFNIN